MLYGPVIGQDRRLPCRNFRERSAIAMTATVPHQSLRYLIRATGTPELTTNNLLEALLIADRAMYRAFLDAVGTLTGADLVDTRLGRESYTVEGSDGVEERAVHR